MAKYTFIMARADVRACAIKYAIEHGLDEELFTRKSLEDLSKIKGKKKALAYAKAFEEKYKTT